MALAELSNQDIDDYLLDLLAGCKTHVNRIVEYYQGFALGIAKSVHKKSPHLRDELMSEALLTLVKCVNKWVGRVELSVDNFNALLYKTILLELRNFLRINNLIRTPHTKGIKPLSHIQIAGDMNSVVDPSNEIELLDLMQMIQSCIQTRTESTIYSYRLMGLTDQMISEVIELPLYVVQRTRVRLEKRFLESYLSLME